jgi:hypothetical protein
LTSSPRLRLLALAALLVAVCIGAVVAVFAPMWVAVAVTVALGVPPALNAYLGSRRAYWLEGRRVFRRGWRTKSVELAGLVQADIVVHPARFSHVSVRLADARNSIAVPVAIYSGTRGRELDLLAVRRLADALEFSELIAASSVARLLVAQLRAEAQGAPLQQRPLYRALEAARAHRASRQVVLGEHDLAGLLD